MGKFSDDLVPIAGSGFMFQDMFMEELAGLPVGVDLGLFDLSAPDEQSFLHLLPQNRVAVNIGQFFHCFKISNGMSMI